MYTYMYLYLFIYRETIGLFKAIRTYDWQVCRYRCRHPRPVCGAALLRSFVHMASDGIHTQTQAQTHISKYIKQEQMSGWIFFPLLLLQIPSFVFILDCRCCWWCWCCCSLDAVVWLLYKNRSFVAVDCSSSLYCISIYLCFSRTYASHVELPRHTQIQTQCEINTFTHNTQTRWDDLYDLDFIDMNWTHDLNIFAETTVHSTTFTEIRSSS